MESPRSLLRSVTPLLKEPPQERARHLRRLLPALRPPSEELLRRLTLPRPLFGLGYVHARPRLSREGISKGVLSTNRPDEVLPLLDPERWIVILTTHNAVPMPRHPLAHLYMADKAVLLLSPRPGVPLSFRDFTSESDFFPLATEKVYDVFLNACYLPLKRAHLLLDAMIFARQSGRPLSALCVGYHWGEESSGGTRRDLESSMRDKIKEFQLDVATPEPCWDVRQVNQWYNQSRLAVLPSMTEAGPRVMAEAFLADIPYLGARDCYGGSTAYISPSNGELFEPEPRSLAKAVWHTLDRLDTYEPRQWALQHMCRSVAIKRLRQALRRFSRRRGWRVNLDLDGRAALAWDWYHDALFAELDC